MSGAVRIDARGMIIREGEDPELGRPLRSAAESHATDLRASGRTLEQRQVSTRSSQPRGSILGCLRRTFVRPFCCFPDAAGARPEGAYTGFWLPPILGLAPIFWLTIFAAIGCGILAQFYWQPLLLTGLVVLGYILSVALHEFAHAATAFKGGDESVVYSGYLTLDYLRYTSPLFSLGLPLLFLLLGNVALPGAAVLIQHENLRGAQWRTLTALAGPLATFLSGLLFSGLLHLSLLSADYYYTILHMGLACLIYFEAMSFIINMIPLPPLDGWAALEPWLPHSCFLKKAMDDPTLQRIVPLLVLAALFPVFARVPFFGHAVNVVAVTIFRAPPDLTPLAMQYFAVPYSQWRYMHPIPVPVDMRRASVSSSEFLEDFLLQ
ncbi:peptidase, M50 family protein [Toxoplasma gondii ME49]|uniref:Peptidase, M50 family protein n=2 Tax=Toxoplasma gondii TaxID=5811 RepID=S8G7G4_TOXGM|nr:peptidase, M50 family protein [Toxoplasma gondii ME49]EPT27680.1 peptidase, M50 family protein [Toxoplasma gondii ME49]|eukprot:XP_002368713.1 peptidase, M50 family protein [Toxoplasma gondii ME49]